MLSCDVESSILVGDDGNLGILTRTALDQASVNRVYMRGLCRKSVQTASIPTGPAGELIFFLLSFSFKFLDLARSLLKLMEVEYGQDGGVEA